MALNMAQIRDTKWLTLEVCREFQRGTCSRSDQECKFAHPAKSCQVDNGRVIACFDSLKVRKGRRWTGSLEVRSQATDKRMSTFSLTDTSRKYIWSYKLEMAVVYSLLNARAHHLALTCALSLVPPISGQVTATCDQGHWEGECGGGVELQLFRFRKQKSGACNCVLWNFRAQTVFWVLFTALISNRSHLGVSHIHHWLRWNKQIVAWSYHISTVRVDVINPVVCQLLNGKIQMNRAVTCPDSYGCPEHNTFQQLDRNEAIASSCRSHSVKPLPVQRPRGS